MIRLPIRIAFIITLALFMGVLPGLTQDAGEVASPNGLLTVLLRYDTSATLIIRHKNETLFSVENPSLVIKPGPVPVKIRSVAHREIRQTQYPVIREKRATVRDHCNEMHVHFSNKTSLIIRAYDDGVAYRFETRLGKDSLVIHDETGSLQFHPSDSLVAPLIVCRKDPGVDCFHTSFEEEYKYMTTGELGPNDNSYLPVYLRTMNGFSISVTESDLNNYPGLFLGGCANQTGVLCFRFPKYPKETAVFGDHFKQELVVTRESYLARTIGNRYFPWRVFIVGKHDCDLVNSDMVYRLASGNRLSETGWIRPGMITDEWIINSTLYGVDFKSGINTATYRFYIDFAARFGLEYVFLDAGWSDVDDFSKRNPEVDLPGVLHYAAEKNVGIWLWTSALTLGKNMQIMQEFKDMGVKGIMVDFMDREDQKTVDFIEKVAEETARNRLMVLFHGASKPVGLRKAYPNVISREGVAGHEFDKWTARITPDHNLTIPFTRMIAGPLDYEAGCMLNAQKDVFRIVDPIPMSQGTRIHQLAMYMVYESPLQYLAGNISDYLREPEYAAFFSSIPTVWDETIALDGKTGDYILIARKSGAEWWVGAMTDWTPRTMQLNLSFLQDGTYRADIYSDGLNADRYASDYTTSEIRVNPSQTLTLNMQAGGGWVARFRKTEDSGTTP